ncbi:hypothetical protein [Aquimarina agarivorans]|uniref:hypothetical protein n=1 Tax=Aquimarina agarivorans TaxID=980584 RepID=UPI000248FC7E|nr:hypothetical protein [Aquimarina agarivorans]
MKTKPYNNRLVFLLTPIICIGFIVLAYSGLMDFKAVQVLWTVLLFYYIYLIGYLLKDLSKAAKNADSIKD